MEEWSAAEVEAHLEAYRVIMDEVEARGELVTSVILSGPDRALIVRGGDSETSVTRGPFTHVDEWVAGFQIFDVRDEARVLEIATRLSTVPGHRGLPTNQAIHVRPLYDEAPSTPEAMAEYLRDAN
jgi:hypothetical protein